MSKIVEGKILVDGTDYVQNTDTFMSDTLEPYNDTVHASVYNAYVKYCKIIYKEGLGYCY